MPKIEGYIDKTRNVYVVTKDEDGILKNAFELPPQEVREYNDKYVKEMLEKYKPEFMK